MEIYKEFFFMCAVWLVNVRAMFITRKIEIVYILKLTTYFQILGQNKKITILQSFKQKSPFIGP